MNINSFQDYAVNIHCIYENAMCDPISFIKSVICSDEVKIFFNDRKLFHYFNLNDVMA